MLSSFLWNECEYSPYPKTNPGRLIFHVACNSINSNPHRLRHLAHTESPYPSLPLSHCQLFDKVEVTKPMASRATSAEIYVICTGYRAPSKIDPRLLDSRHVFLQVDEPVKVRGTFCEPSRNPSGTFPLPATAPRDAAI